ncbi:hypothetical protein QTQ03_20200 [Micromonospora sp. WMMA1363]|uniref:hypothetical protein n=1 Tax=Micromonospora sp. WMMA1363 TaxID=3053985 RepID=UPI00259CDE24|nr:hypothetical protein [Micromonospora sp. WMMA1363]MDM4721803.1 hypothetical protein [Micromonospora sp. WMMA1363]
MSFEPLRCAGAPIVDDDGRLFVRRRPPGRRLYSNCWDSVGGHLEPGEEGLTRRTTGDACALLGTIHP